MSYVTIKDNCVCGSRFSYDDNHGVNAKREDQVEGIYFLAQVEYRHWQEVHKPCREAWANSLKPSEKIEVKGSAFGLKSLEEESAGGLT